MSKFQYWQDIASKESVDDYVLEILKDWKHDLEVSEQIRQSRKRLVCLARADRKAFFAMYQTAAIYKQKLDAIHTQLIIAENFNPTDPSIQKALEIIGGE